MQAPSTARSAVLRQRDALDTAAADAGSFECDVEPRDLRMRGEPARSRDVHVVHFLLVDHLQRVPEGRTALFLDLDDEDAAAATEDEVEFEAADACVRSE
jgi:hypothetical protein